MFIAFGFEVGTYPAAVLVLVPMWIYFFLQLAQRSPGIKLVFLKKKYVITRNIFGVYTGVFSSLALIANLLSIRQLNHLLFAAVLIPVVAHFGVVLSTKVKKAKSKKAAFVRINLDEETEQKPLQKKEDKRHVLIATPETSDEVTEEKRRAFIKLIAGAGAGVFLTSILNPGKASAAFFGSVPGPGVIAIKDSTDTKIDPAIKSPTDGYGISMVDSASYPAYYGFVNKDGAWYILQENPQNTFLYAKGGSSFSTNWTGRAGLTYASYDVTF